MRSVYARPRFICPREPAPLEVPRQSSPWAAAWLLAAVIAILAVGLLLLPLFRVG